MQPYPGLMVLYRPRPGQIRAGQVDLAAMVTAVYAGDRCDLNIYPPMSEPYQQPKVPALSEEFTSHVWIMPAAFAAVCVPNGRPPATIEDAEAFLAPLIERIAALEAKRGPGRPPNPAKAEQAA